MIFAAPKYLLLILLAFALPVGHGLLLLVRRARVRKFGDPSLVDGLMPSWSRAKGWWHCILLSVCIFFLALGLARPQTGARLSEHKARGAEVVVVLDVSNSMLAKDYSPNRLERAKLAISRLSDRLKEDRIGLVVFAGSSFVQLPVTTDYVSAKMFLSNISTESVPVQGTAMGEAILTAVRCFSPQSEKSRAIVVITDGENHEDDPVEAASQAAEMGIKVYTIGVGSAEGQPIPVGGELLKDREGNIVVTRLDEEVLRKVAAAGGGAYVHAGNEEFGLNPIIDDIRKMEQEEFASIQFAEYDEQFMIFLEFALVALMLDLLLGWRRAKRQLF